MKNILLIRMGGLGDLLAVLPSVRLLRAAHPASRLTLVCREDYGALLLRTGVVDALEPQGRPRFAGLFADPGSIPEETVSWLAGFDFVIGWMQGQAGLGLKGAPDRHGIENLFLAYEPESGLPVARYFYEATAALLDPAESRRFSYETLFFLPVLESIGERVWFLPEKYGVPQGRPYAVIHPGAGGKQKRWPLERYLEIARRLAGRGIAGLIVLGEAEGDLLRDLGSFNLPESWRSVLKPDLLDLAGLLARSALYLGNDSGVTHLSASCGTKVLVVSRKEADRAWSPGGDSIVLGADETDWISVETVMSAAGRLLSGL